MKTSLPAAALAAVVLLFVAANGTRAATFTNEADFINNIAAPYLVETFGSIQTSGFVASPTNFSGNGYSFDAITTSNHVDSPPSSLYGYVSGSNHWLTVYYDNDNVVFTNFSLNVSAIGGYFFLTDDVPAFTSGEIYVTAQLSDSTLVSNNVTPASATSFFGFTFATNVISFKIGDTNDYKYPTAAKVIVGTTIPEPSSLALLLLGAGAAALLVFKKRKG